MSERYEIVVEEEIGDAWSEWFAPMEIAHGGRGTMLRGPVADQAALYGLLNKLRDLGLTLIALRRMEGGREF